MGGEIMDKKTLGMHRRQARIMAEIERNPFITDEELASLCNVSIHTIRADRRKTGIPEVRERTKDVARFLFGQAKTLSAQEITGDLLEVELNREGLSLLDTGEQMTIRKSGIVRGHILFAQANSLANAIVDADLALTRECHIKFLAPVRAGERVLAKARVTKTKGRRKEVEVIMKTREKVVFRGEFTILCLDARFASRLKISKREPLANEGEKA